MTIEASATPPSWRVLLVDDERLARSRMRRLLEAYIQNAAGPQNSLHVTEAASVMEAVEALQAAEEGEGIDVIFLDIQMSGRSGFALFDLCEVKAHVVFVTAFGEHAIRAFEVNALDYLVKPVSPERLELCLSRLSRTRAPAGRLAEEDKVHIEFDGTHKFVALREVLGVRAAGDYTEVLLADGSTPWTRLSLSVWESRLGSDDYMRVHRGVIVRLDAIDAVHKKGAALTLEVKHHALPVSRRIAPRLRRRLRAFHALSE